MRFRYVLVVLGSLAAVTTRCEKDPTQSMAPSLAFVTQPSTAVNGQTISAIQVAVRGAHGNRLTTSTESVTLALGPNSGSATLSGTLTVAAIQGIATFRDLRINRPGRGFTLAASAPGLTGATSDTFAVALAFAVMSAGERHTCGVTTDDEGYCWGSDYNGRLGYNPADWEDQLAPAPAAGGLTFASVNAGFLHTCGLTRTGVAYCWGHNAVGAIGDGSTIDRSTPTVVAGGLVFVALSTAGDHTCGLTTAGAAYCWGSNASGKLGDGTMITRTSPVAVVGGLNFATLSVGSYHTCGVTTAGAAYCWGYNFHGQLGDGTTTDRSRPVAVDGGLTFQNVNAGAFHTCGLTTAGAYCWGSNSFGQLGNEGVIDRTGPELVRFGQFASLSAGAWHTCGVSTEHTIFCWGRNGHGELGDGTRTDRWMPTPVKSLVQGGRPKLSTGAFYTCAVTEGYAAYCWGSNLEGQLGDGTTIDRLTPVRVAPPASP